MTRPTATSPGHVAVAVTRDDPPKLLIATDDDTLTRAVATHVVAQEDPSSFTPEDLNRVREALLDERWVEAVAIWMDSVGTSIDVYPDEQVINHSNFTTEATSFSIRMANIFSDGSGQD